MINVKQIKAARILLDWTQDDLARKSGLSKAAIANIERGSASPRQETLDLLQQTFQLNGVAFLEHSGVQLIGERFDLKIWDGRNSQLKLWVDIEKELAGMDYPILHISSVSDRPMAERYPKECQAYIKKMDAMNVERRILLCEGDNEILVAQPQWYRQMPKMLFDQIPYYVYGGKVVFLFWELQRIVRIDNPNMAQGFKRQFDYNWSISQPLKDYVSIF